MWIIGEQTNPLYRTYVETTWLWLKPGETRRVEVMLEYALDPNRDEVPADVRDADRRQIEKLSRVPNLLGLHTYAEDPHDYPRHALELLGGAGIEVTTGRATDVESFGNDGPVVVGRIVTVDDRAARRRGQRRRDGHRRSRRARALRQPRRADRTRRHVLRPIPGRRVQAHAGRVPAVARVRPVRTSSGSSAAEGSPQNVSLIRSSDQARRGVVLEGVGVRAPEGDRRSGSSAGNVFHLVSSDQCGKLVMAGLVGPTEPADLSLPAGDQRNRSTSSDRAS